MLPALVIIAKEGFQDHEFAGTELALIEAGFEVIVASTEVGDCRGKFSTIVPAQMELKDIKVTDFDRIAFIGGPGAKTLQHDKDAHRIAKETLAAGKVLGAICIAPTILAYAGVLDGKNVTAWNEDGDTEKILTDAGATFTDEDVTVDGLLVTGNGPDAAEEFGETLA